MRPAALQARFDAIKEDGCIVAHILGLGWTYPEIHHLLHAGKRGGDRFTIGLNPWSHRGVPFGGLSIAQCRDLFGPSLAHGSKPFRARFGTDDALLAMQDDRIGWTQEVAA